MKDFKSLEQQKEYLIENKNIIDDGNIEQILSNRAYASLINPYKKFFYTGINGDCHTYDDKVSILDYLEIANYDDFISNKLNYLIGHFERKIKFAFAYEISKKMASSGDERCTSYVDLIKNVESDPSSITVLGFNPVNIYYNKRLKTEEKANERTVEYRISLLLKIANKDDGNKKRNNLYKKYLKSDANIPFWLVVHSLSLGELLGLYEMMDEEMKGNILDRLNEHNTRYVKDESIFKFESDLYIIKEIRNVINHYEPLYEFILRNKMKRIKRSINRLSIYSNPLYDEAIRLSIIVKDNDHKKDNIDVINLYNTIHDI